MGQRQEAWIPKTELFEKKRIRNFGAGTLRTKTSKHFLLLAWEMVVNVHALPFPEFPINHLAEVQQQPTL